MASYTTPGVYVKEIPSFPPSVAEVGTAIPAFLGCTEKATHATTGERLANKPTKIYSFEEFKSHYGNPNPQQIDVAIAEDANGNLSATPVADAVPSFLLYFAVQMYFDNGGGQCYVVSTGDYSAAPALQGLQDGLKAIGLEDEPTLIVIPEAIKLADADYGTLVTAVLKQCGSLQDRFGVFDLKHGLEAGYSKAQVDTERGWFGNENLSYGAAYYPFLRTSLHPYVKDDETNVEVAVGGAAAVQLGTLKAAKTVQYNFVKAEINKRCLLMPPSGAVAGIYAATDSKRGVWKAPANVSLADVIEPVAKLDDAKQGELNVDSTSGKSVNAIRSFAGKGTLVWGARTLLGNDNEWRYVSVRRFFNMVEESVKKSTYWAVFEPNDANTWVKVRGMIEGYLTDKWRDGALAGSTPKEAFFVKCGLGTTMSAQDILEGRMNVEIGMAAVRPAEFIILKFSHKMQTS